MANQMRPASPEQAPDPSYNYERAHPGREPGMGRMDNNDGATPANVGDQQDQAVLNRQKPDRQVNAEDLPQSHRVPPHQQPGHSMADEEPLGWDQAPQDVHDPRQQRHPRTEGKGGTPDEGEARVAEQHRQRHGEGPPP
jgi:hypothetical protein